MPIPNLNEATIRHHATSQSFERGEAYYRSHAVATLTQRGNTLQAEVEGSEVHPYRVTFQFDTAGFTFADCTCAYNYGGWCKHIVAAALVCLHQPEKIEQRLPLERLLDRLDHLQTQRLVQNLVEDYPELIETIERHVNLIATPTPSKQPSPSSDRTTIDPPPFRRQVQQILRDGLRRLEEGWEEDPITDDILPLIQQAEELIERGDSYNALVVLQSIASSCCHNKYSGSRSYEVQ